MGPRSAGETRTHVRVLFALIVGAQVFLAVWGIADQWTRGHNGWNGAAYQNAARNTLRWGVVFPLQYETANEPPKPEQLYTHAPLGLHLHNVASVKLFGDRESSIRVVAAFWNVAVLLMLFAVVRRSWDDAHALTACAFYVALPINAIYTNMANHSAGFIFWSLLTLHLYVTSPPSSWSRWRYAAFLFAFTMAAAWDWPAYYVAAVIAGHWVLADRGRGRARLLGFCAWVMLVFVAHFVLVEALTGNLDELTTTFNARRALAWSFFLVHLVWVPELMFTLPVLALTIAWIGRWAWRTFRGEARRRDLLPIAFLAAGVIHYWTFRWSAVLHSYWAWPLLPGVAIAMACALLGAGSWIRARLGGIASVAVVLLVLPLGLRVADIVPAGRSVGGSMWFIAPLRGPVQAYDSGRPELRFARRVKAWTDRSTGVQLHTSLKPKRLEPRFDITLDRVTHRWSTSPRPSMPLQRGVTGWVFVAAVDAFSESERAAFAARHPYRQHGDYFMLDLREDTGGVEAWSLTPTLKSVRWWLLHSAFEPPVRTTRSVAVEQSLRRKVIDLDEE